MQYKISKNNKHLCGSINLPSSKSISNRLLIIRALSGDDSNITNLSISNDTKILNEILHSNQSTFYVDGVGTAMRFLTAYLSQKPGIWLLTCSERMKYRPIGILVDALRKLGAKIDYIERYGYPPLRIQGTNLKKNYVEIDASISSQFISALLLIAPVLPNGLIIKLKNRIVSKPYIHTTLELMKNAGISYKWNDDTISVFHGKYLNKKHTVESDWSAASYWYEMAALSDNVDLYLYGLEKNSIQADCLIVKYFKNLGVDTTFVNNGIHLSKKISCFTDYLDINLVDTPDIVQTLAVTAGLKEIPFRFSGINSLKIKETNRIEALQNEMSKLYVNITEPEEGVIEGQIIGNANNCNVINTYNDHRMAMSFAPTSIVSNNIIIDNPDVVSKSYPNYWEDIKSVGFIIEKFY